MKKIVRERRLEMLKAARMNVKPKTFIPILAEKYGVNEKTMWRDWQRRKGINGWILKLVALGDVYTVISTQLIDNALKQGELEGASAQHVSLSMKATVSAELRALRAEQRDIMGILPLVQQPVILEPEPVPMAPAMALFDAFIQIDKEATIKIVRKMLRSEAYLEGHL